MVESIIAISHKHGMAMLAESVETHGQFEALKAGGCDGFQGYFFSRHSKLLIWDVISSPSGQALAVIGVFPTILFTVDNKAKLSDETRVGRYGALGRNRTFHMNQILKSVYWCWHTDWHTSYRLLG